MNFITNSARFAYIDTLNDEFNTSILNNEQWARMQSAVVIIFYFNIPLMLRYEVEFNIWPY